MYIFFQKDILYQTFWYQHFEYQMKTELTVIFSFFFNYENPFFLQFDIFVALFGPLKLPKHFYIYLFIKLFALLVILVSTFWSLNDNWTHGDFLNDFSSYYPIIQKNVKIVGKVSSRAHFKDNLMLIKNWIGTMSLKLLVFVLKRGVGYIAVLVITPT